METFDFFSLRFLKKLPIYSGCFHQREECLETQREALRPTGIISSDKWRPKVLGRAVFVAGFPVGCAAAAPAYNPSVYAGANQAFPSGYARGTPFKMSCSPNTNQSGAPIPNRAPTHSTVYCG
ncbi:myelin-associated neurite-outgrowth inhibitor-like isoform X2 [Acanthopagrus latus]|uniref:myelin-associated neurite-outgrowth inhibitor-like isoform X2 n=1 Tax=Acanthopagrus latus TaxID=8177 RepID=UPI00187D053A|nr:myelin-associated neurite-outgrowth inhibitor-like isoform X2 [Acanthopagrus latus]